MNSFFMLFFDNFSSLLGILAGMISCPAIATSFSNPAANFTDADGNPMASDDGNYYTRGEYDDAFFKMVFTQVCPGIGCALLFGNIWYAMMAAKLSTTTGREDHTALPYGINTPAGFLTVYMVMLPLCFGNSPDNPFTKGKNPEEFAQAAFQGACLANLVGGAFEVIGIVLAEPLRKHLPKAALYAPICGVGFIWLGYSPLIDVMREPLIGFIPLALCFTGFFACRGAGVYTRNIPTALLIFVTGTVLWWVGLARWDTETRVGDGGDLNQREWMVKTLERMWDLTGGKNNWSPGIALAGTLSLRAVAIQIPIAIASFIETIENVEAAASVEGTTVINGKVLELKPDCYNVKEAMLADGLGTMFGALCGAVMPTTVYIGHRRHKSTDARWLYSFLNGVVFFILMMSGLMGVIFYAIDPVSIGVILIAVGLMIVQSSMELSASRHYPALLIGIMIPLSEMVYFDHFNAGVGHATRSLGRSRGVANMAPGGGILASMFVTAILCDLTDSRFFRASIWCVIACLLSLFGLMHGNNQVFVDGNEIEAHTGGFGVVGDPYTSDFGEVMLSTARSATGDFLGLNVPGGPGPWGEANKDDWNYFINNRGSYESVTNYRSANEGWRFSIAYAVLAVFCAAHFGMQKAGIMKDPVEMDNGVGGGPTGAWATSEVKTTATAPKKETEAA
jgi:AGZA family xanthine/uracil permease-like MFS transporter